MPVSLSSHIQLRPVAIPVERNAGLITRIHFLEFVEIDVAGHRIGEEAEGDLVLGIGLRKKVVEEAPVL